MDIRTGFWNIFVYMISYDGEFLWGSDGIALSDNEIFETSPKVVMTDESNYVFAWSRLDSPGVVVLQKVSPDTPGVYLCHLTTGDMNLTRSLVICR